MKTEKYYQDQANRKVFPSGIQGAQPKISPEHKGRVYCFKNTAFKY